MTADVTDPWPAPSVRGPVDHTVTLPGSKSLTNRAVLLAALADGPSVIRRPLRSRDTDLMLAALRAIGAEIDVRDDDWHIRPISERPVGSVALDCGLAGTVLRFVPAAAGLVRGAVGFDGDPHLRKRPIGAVLEALRGLGVDIEGDEVPFTVRGAGKVPGGKVVIDAAESSQFVSALLLSGARYDEGVDVLHDGKPVPSQPHIDMTVSMLRRRGVEVDDAEPDRWRVAPGPISGVDETIEPDLSNAAPFLALAAVSGGRMTVRDWPRETTQAGDALREILALMGCSVSLGEDGLTVIGGDAIRGIDIDLHDVGELTPAVAALCALAESPSYLRGVEHIRGHETDRLAALATELTAVGAEVTEHSDGLSLRPAALRGGLFRTYADHRMAHAGVILGAAVEGIVVENVATTSKTFTDFAPFWAALVGSP